MSETLFCYAQFSSGSNLQFADKPYFGLEGVDCPVEPTLVIGTPLGVGHRSC